MSASNDTKYGEGMVGGYNIGRLTNKLHRLTAYSTTHYEMHLSVTMKGGAKALAWINEQLAQGKKVIIEAKEKTWRPKQQLCRGYHWKKMAEVQPT